MNPKHVKTILIVVFIVLTASLTYLGLNRNSAQIDFTALEKEKFEAVGIQKETEFQSLIKNIGSSTSLIKPDILQSNDTSRLSLSVRLLDTMKLYLYAGVLTERLAGIQQSPYRYHQGARYYLLATENHQHEYMLFKKAKNNLEKSLELRADNLDAKVDLAVCIYNINNLHKPENPMDLMKPALILREVVKADSNHIDGLYYLGKLALESNQVEKAIERFKKLVSLQPENQEFYMELSRIYLSVGNTQEAKAWKLKASALNK